MKMRPLRPGDRVALVAPSSPFDTEEFTKASSILECRGYRAICGKHASERKGYLAGSDLERAEDLVQAFSDPSIAAVVCIRGGYGSGRLLDWLPFSILSQNPKILLGYSDITFLHAAFHRQLGWVTFHGPNFIEMSDEGFPSTATVFSALEGKEEFAWKIDDHHVIRDGSGEGKIIGGNLTCFAHLIGTPYFPDPSGSLLFVEDRGEALYRLDRTFTQLKLAGILEHIRGLILGSFQDCGPPEEIWDVVLEHTHAFSFPIVCGLPFGHGLENDVLPLRLPFFLDTRQGILKALESPFDSISDRPPIRLGRAHSQSDPQQGFPSPSIPFRSGAFDLDDLFNEALRSRMFSAASILVADAERVLFHRTWGRQRFGGMLIDESTRFDLASLTKPLVVAPLLMHALGRGVVGLDDSLAKYFPPASLSEGHGKITLRHLLNHCSGLPPYEPFYLELIRIPFHRRKASLLKRILSTPLVSEPGKACQYSDLGFILLGFIVEEVLRASLDCLVWDFYANHGLSCAKHVEHRIPGCQSEPRAVQPQTAIELERSGLAYRRLLSSQDPTVRPRQGEDLDSSFVATELCPWRNRILQGEVHDENTYCLGGVAGHAGLFGTASAVYNALSFLWRVYRGAMNAEGLPRDSVELFWTRQEIVPNSSWALGYDTPTPGCSSAGSLLSPHSVGHLGFTGTSFWIDLDRERLVILLSNRVHLSRANDKIKLFRPVLHNLVMEMFSDQSKD